MLNHDGPCQRRQQQQSKIGGVVHTSTYDGDETNIKADVGRDPKGCKRQQEHGQPQRKLDVIETSSNHCFNRAKLEWAQVKEAFNMQPGNTCRQGPRKLASGPIPSLAHTLRDEDLKTKILDYKPAINFREGLSPPGSGSV